LHKRVNKYTIVVIGFMYHSILINLTKPHIVALAESIENLHRYVGMAHLRNQSTICTVTYIDRSILFGSVADQRFGTFKWVYMVLEGSHNFVLIEIGNPVEEGKEISGRITIKGLTDW